MDIYIGAEYIHTALGKGASANFEQLVQNNSAITHFAQKGFSGNDVYLAKINNINPQQYFNVLLDEAIANVLSNSNISLINNPDVLLILSSTKGDLSAGFDEAMTAPLTYLKQIYQLANQPQLISNACISGVLSIVTAANVIEAGFYKQVLVIGIDVIADFVLYGFESLYAMSQAPCEPFSENRKGITLGEACAAVLLSNDKNVFKQNCVQYVAGSSANDANHISGPSRTGEGLVRTINKTLQQAGVTANQIDFVSAHGTATVFNDEMESIAFDRTQLAQTPINSLKGYYGHTLGAAGVLETAICIQSMHQQMLIKSLGYHSCGTSVPLNIITKNSHQPLHLVLKTASGFGGCNASLILKK